MSEKNKHSHPHQSATSSNDTLAWDNKVGKQDNCDSIIFDNDVTPFIESEEVAVDPKELQDYQQQVADEMQLKFTGVIDSNANNNEPLLLSDHPTEDGHFLRKVIAKLTGGDHTFIIVILVHAFIITVALIYGRVDISGIKDMPITPSSAKPLPPLKSYLMTQAEYDKLVERAQLNSAEQSVEAETSEVMSETSSKKD
ncbi:hypothetical protein [Shewanella polaris]|uniref:Uncharacterized protein n=1 Tax=Shewanella polaris TaxID=2588449 RepID=A0A4Y5YF24_9GAMM|nr:hypothetical protein [Shewanella polaris]QDE31382.1 hypothetical protein FH971_10595 [Shewanella polaris]